MKVYILYRAQSENNRLVEEFVHDFKHDQATRQLELIDVDTPNGIAMASLYEIMQYPAVLALSNDGQLVKSWQGAFPLKDELAFYAQGD